MPGEMLLFVVNTRRNTGNNFVGQCTGKIRTKWLLKLRVVGLGPLHNLGHKLDPLPVVQSESFALAVRNVGQAAGGPAINSLALIIKAGMSASGYIRFATGGHSQAGRTFKIT
jgi:hypothetical protein